MLPSASRLRRRSDFAVAVRRGRRAGRTRLVVHVDHDPDTTAVAACPMAGFVVSKAVGGAVVRNRVRRQLRHLVAGRIGSFPAGTRLVVRALPPAAGASSADLGADLDAALARANRTSNGPDSSRENTLVIAR